MQKVLCVEILLKWVSTSIQLKHKNQQIRPNMSMSINQGSEGTPYKKGIFCMTNMNNTNGGEGEHGNYWLDSPFVCVRAR